MLPVPKAEETIEKKPKPEKKVKAPAIINEHDGMVLYADAGVRPNPGFGGWGVHGYIYSDNVPKKGAGNPTQALTSLGYVPKSEKPVEVTPLHYMDSYGTIGHTTNNGGEVTAASSGMAYAIQYPIKKLTILTDSAYVVKGTMEYLNKWRVNNWRKQDGTEISNKSCWQALDKNLSALLDKNVDVTVRWVKGHNGDQGNELADKYATIGVMQSQRGKIRSQTETTKAEGYWGGSDEKHPFLTHRRCYMTTHPEFNTPGEYYLGEHGKDDELLGKRMADGAYAYVLLNTPDPCVEILRKKQLEEATTEDAIVMCRLDKLFELEMRTDLMRFGDVVLIRPDKNKQDLHFVDSMNVEPVTKELRPPRLAIRAVEAVNVLKGILLDYKNNPNSELVTTDITKELYDIDTKGEYKLKPTFVAGVTDFSIKAKYHKDQPNELVDLKLVLGIDLPGRNTFKRLEKLKPIVTQLVWKESPKALRFATVVKIPDAIGIWCGFYTNFKYLDKI